MLPILRDTGGLEAYLSNRGFEAINLPWVDEALKSYKTLQKD